LLEGGATRGGAPFQAVLTHGFTLDEAGEKMSKSKGNTVEPQAVTRESGAEILRLWTAMVDYADDQRIGKTILQTTIDAYRKLRNTVRYLLGALADFEPAERIAPEAMPPLERFILHRLWELDGQVREAYAGYRFQDVIRALADFSSNELSALYFDVRKDSLYCDRPDSDRRRAARTVMDLIFERLTAWLSPLLSFTMEEAWTTRFPQGGSNVLRVIPETPESWRDDAEAARWAKVQRVLAAVTAALEVERREKRIGSALDAAPVVHVNDPALHAAFAGLDAAEVFRTSQAQVVLGENGALPAGAFVGPDDPLIAVEPRRAEGRKCARSWKVLPEVQKNYDRLGRSLPRQRPPRRRRGPDRPARRTDRNRRQAGALRLRTGRAGHRARPGLQVLGAERLRAARPRFGGGAALLLAEHGVEPGGELRPAAGGRRHRALGTGDLLRAGGAGLGGLGAQGGAAAARHRAGSGDRRRHRKSDRPGALRGGGGLPRLLAAVFPLGVQCR
jgi:hypothetical protein